MDSQQIISGNPSLTAVLLLVSLLHLPVLVNRYAGIAARGMTPQLRIDMSKSASWLLRRPLSAQVKRLLLLYWL
jgi:hypothetical protein